MYIFSSIFNTAWYLLHGQRGWHGVSGERLAITNFTEHYVPSEPTVSRYPSPPSFAIVPLAFPANPFSSHPPAILSFLVFLLHLHSAGSIFLSE